MNNSHYGLIIEGLRKKEPIIEDIDSYGSIIGEKVEWEPLWFDTEAVEEQGIIDEASAVTFNKKSYPKEGWAVIMAGGAGSGKGFVISKSVLIDAKVIDVDNIKKMYNKLISKKEGLPEGKLKWDLKDPKDVAELHRIIKEKGWREDVVNQFFTSNNKLRNIIFDITGKSASTLTNYTKMVKDLGYEVSLVWVVTNREVAIVRNLTRDRVVPENQFHAIHNQVNDTILPFLKDPNTSKNVDEAWVVFSGPAVSEIEDGGNTSITVRTDLKDKAFKLIKKGRAFTTFTTLKGAVIDIVGKIMEWLGPKEDLEGDRKYKDFDTMNKEIEGLKKQEGSDRPLAGQKIGAMR